METIASFKVNHNILQKGMYISRIDGDVVTYDPQMTTNGAVPIQTVTTPFMDGQWFQALQQFKQDAYEMVGISQLSATTQTVIDQHRRNFHLW